jgi:hypothetical protein
MKYNLKPLFCAIFTLSFLIQTVYGDIVADRNVIRKGASAFSNLDVIFAIIAITVIWIVSLSVMKRIRDKCVHAYCKR